MITSHVLLSAPAVRERMLARLGRVWFYAVYSVLSTAAFALLAWAYWRAPAGASFYEPLPGAGPAAVLLMPLAVFLVLCRLSTPYGQPSAPLPPTGIYRVCRYPGSLGLLLWVFLHLANRGQDRTVILFAAMAVMIILAVLKNEALRRHLARAGVGAHMDTTSLMPFAAILAGRQTLVPSEIGWGRLALSLALYAAVLLGHISVIGADPLAAFR